MYKKRGLRLVAFLVMLCLMSNKVMLYEANAATGQMITITATGQIVDSFNGVDSLYRPGSGDGSDSTYGCHAYVIRYYQTVYGKTVYNLFHAQTPMAYGDSFVQVTTPQLGDICAQIKSSSNHWSIVKSVAGTTVSVIDQNNKWVASGVTYAYKDFTYDVSEVVFYRLASIESGVNTNSVVASSQVITTTEAVTTTQVPATTTEAPVVTEAVESSTSDDETVKVPAQKLKIASKDVTLPKSYKWKLTATVSPSNTTDKITYKSSNKKIATVSKKGVVKSKKKRGKTTITVKTSSGKKKKCIVRVY